MRFGLTVPNIAEYADPLLLRDLARDAEAAGWDAFFVWDHLLYRLDPVYPLVDPWVALAACATATSRVLLGPMVTPLARRRPSVVARQVATLDLLSGGRVVLGAGLGTPRDAEFEAFGDPGDERVRAALLDEGLDVVAGLLRGEPFRYDGRHVRVGTDAGESVTFLPTPAGGRSVPVWIAARWPSAAVGPYRRAARWDGLFVIGAGSESVTPDQTAAARAAALAHRSPADLAAGRPFDVIVDGRTDGPSASVAAWAEAGATWWLEHVSWKRAPLDECRARIVAGPPRG